MSLADSDPILYVVVTPPGKGADRIDVTDTVMSFEFEEDEKKTDQMKLTVDNWDLSNFDNPVWREGNSITVAWGYPGKLAPSRECIIQKVEGSIALTVTAQAKSLLMNRDVKSKTFNNTTRSKVVKEIANSYGYDDAHCFIQETTTLYEGIGQARQTDGQFVKKLAEAEHFEFYVDFAGFHWHPRKMGQKSLRVMQYYLPPDVGDIKAFNVENDPFAKPTVIQNVGRDPVTKKDVTGKASDADTARMVLVAPDTGVTSPSAVTTQVVTQPTTETNAAQVKNEADGAFKRTRLSVVKLSLDCIGDPLVIAKTVIDVRGISKRLSGLYYINSANHKIDSGGYSMALKVSTDSANGDTYDLLSVAEQEKKKPTKAVLNPSQAGDTKDPSEATPHVVVDPTTGGTAVRYSPDPVAPQTKGK